MGKVISCNKCGKRISIDDRESRNTCKSCLCKDKPKVHTGKPGVSDGGMMPNNKIVPERWSK